MFERGADDPSPTRATLGTRMQASAHWAHLVKAGPVDKKGLAGGQFLGHQEGELEGLHVVQAGVAERLVAGRQGGLVDVL